MLYLQVPAGVGALLIRMDLDTQSVGLTYTDSRALYTMARL